MTLDNSDPNFLRTLPPPSTSGVGPRSWNPVAIGAILAFALAGAIGGIVVGHIALASIARNGGEGRKTVLAIVIVSWVLMGLLAIFAATGFLRSSAS